MEFRNFVRALLNYQAGRPFDLPLFTWSHLSSWRIFVQVFPGAFHMIEAILKGRLSCTSRIAGEEHTQECSALLLTSAIANTGDLRLRDRAIRVLRDVSARFEYSHTGREELYPVLRQYKFCRAEAEGGLYVAKCVEFLRRSEKKHPGIDPKRMRKYYRSNNQITMQASKRKLLNPRGRDLNTEKITLAIIELVDADFRRSVKGKG